MCQVGVGGEGERMYCIVFVALRNAGCDEMLLQFSWQLAMYGAMLQLTAA